MAHGWTADDLAALNEAIASGVLEVTTGDGKRVRYRDIRELIRARDLVVASLRNRPGRPRFARTGVRGG